MASGAVTAYGRDFAFVHDARFGAFARAIPAGVVRRREDPIM